MGLSTSAIEQSGLPRGLCTREVGDLVFCYHLEAEVFTICWVFKKRGAGVFARLVRLAP